MTLTPQQLLVCNSVQFKNEVLKIFKCSCVSGGQTFEMAVLIAIFAQLAGIPNVTCTQLQAMAAPFACLQRQQQLPALIALASQIISLVPSGGGFVFSGIGSPVGVVFPAVPSAVYVDNTNPNQVGFWNWNGTNWTQIIAP